MASKSDFSAEEWDVLRQAPVLAGIMIITAEKGGSLRESLAVGKEFTTTASAAEGTLVGEIASDMPLMNRESIGEHAELPVRGPELIARAVYLVESRGTVEDSEAFKRFCLDVAESAAEATKSGGTLGIGGKRISQAEGMALDLIAGTLGIARSL